MSRYQHELVWPPFKGKAHKVVDASTGQGVGLYRTPEGARRKAAAMNKAAAVETMPRITAEEANEEVRAMVAATVEPIDHFHDCVRCGQTVITRQDPPICKTCREQDREPQGEAMALFTPAPNQMPGQLNF